MRLTYYMTFFHFCPLLMFRCQCCHLEEHQRQHSKHHRLDKPDEHFKKHKRQWQEIRYQMEHHRKEYFSRKHISEETKGKGDNLAQLRNQFENTDHHADTVGLMKWTDEKLLTVLHDSQSRNTSKLHGNNRDKREGESKVEVSRSATEKRDNSSMSRLAHMVQSHRPQTWQQPGPVGDQNKKEDRCDEGEKLACLFLVLGDTLDELEQRFKDNLEHILQTTWYESGILGHASDEEYKESTDKHTNEQGVGHWQKSQAKQFFRSN